MPCRRPISPPAAIAEKSSASSGEPQTPAAADHHCQFWLPKKRRFCANHPLASSKFCGNHNPDAGSRRIPCPIDPSHFVLEENLECHIKKCPFLKQAQALEAQPYYCKGINRFGRHRDGGYTEEREDVVVGSTSKRNIVMSMSVPEFYEIIDKIKVIHGEVCGVLPESYVVSDACSRWLKCQMDRNLPYQEKHVLQQASILGNMEAFAILENPNKVLIESSSNECARNDASCRDHNATPAVVEFGAGRGYLTQLLTDCYGVRKVFLVERRAYKFKADRSLRQNQDVSLERLRIDIEDLNLQEVKSLKGLQYLAIGKHLCGPATDLTLRCCVDESSGELSGKCLLEGLAVATCCHHLCQWTSYTNTKFMLDMGITEKVFHALTWFTSWGVDADHNSENSEIAHQVTTENTNTDRDDSGLEVKGVEEAIRKMSPLDRAILGFMCKEIIDIGRSLWLRDQGLNTQIVKYVPSTISPENRLLLARHNFGT